MPSVGNLCWYAFYPHGMATPRPISDGTTHAWHGVAWHGKPINTGAMALAFAIKLSDVHFDLNLQKVAQLAYQVFDAGDGANAGWIMTRSQLEQALGASQCAEYSSPEVLERATAIVAHLVSGRASNDNTRTPTHSPPS